MRFLSAVRSLGARIGRYRPSQLSLEDRNILYFGIDTALQGLMMGGIFTFISVFVVRLGASNLVVSLITSLPAIVLMLSSIPAGQFIQQRRDLIRVTNWTRVFHRGSFLVVALLPFFLREALAEVIVVVWAAKSVSSAVLEASWTAVVAEVIPPARRASVNGTRLAVLSLVTAAAVAVFGYILDRLPFPLNYQIVFLISLVGSIAGMYFFALMRIPDNLPAERVKGARASLGQRLRAYVRTFDDPEFVRYELTTFALRFGGSLPAALYSIYWIRHLDASDLWISWQATAGKLALIAGYFAWGKIVSRRGHHLPLLICTVGIGLYPALTGLATSQVWLPLIATVQGFFVTGIDLAFFDTLLAICPPGKRPSYIALNTMLSSLAMFAAPMVGSLLASWMDIRLVFFVASGLHLVAAVLFWRYRIAAEPHEG
ncbi:MAG: MFS transporter [Anaerolineae bacterium]|nr:MFS transporter [Anaerolineae bacterium]